MAYPHDPVGIFVDEITLMVALVGRNYGPDRTGFVRYGNKIIENQGVIEMIENLLQIMPPTYCRQPLHAVVVHNPQAGRLLHVPPCAPCGRAVNSCIKVRELIPPCKL